MIRSHHQVEIQLVSDYPRVAPESPGDFFDGDVVDGPFLVAGFFDQAGQIAGTIFNRPAVVFVDGHNASRDGR